MKSLVALWVFLLFLSVSYGEEYKCVNEMKITYWSTGCDFFESKKKYDDTHLHCRSDDLEILFKNYNEDIVGEYEYDGYAISIGDKGTGYKTEIKGPIEAFFGKKEATENDRLTYDVKNPTEAFKKLIDIRFERYKARVKERDEFLKLLLDNNLCKIVEF